MRSCEDGHLWCLSFNWGHVYHCLPSVCLRVLNYNHRSSLGHHSYSNINKLILIILILIFDINIRYLYNEILIMYSSIIITAVNHCHCSVGVIFHEGVLDVDPGLLHVNVEADDGSSYGAGVEMLKESLTD